MSAPRGSLLEFLEDIEPFFYRRSLLYVDVGAYKGEAFKALLASRLEIGEAHLVEPNPNSVEVLRRNIEGLFKGHILAVHPLAAGATKGTVRLRLAESMSKVVSCSESGATCEESSDSAISVECCTLDELSLQFSDRHISLLKLDVEGFEDQVLAGAAGLLSEQEVDVIYVEAGMDPVVRQQCYFRNIDDILLAHGYRLFRVYEQMHEWKEDSPILRRANFAYFSARFAERNPCLLARELFDAQMQLQAAHTQLQAIQLQAEELAKRAGVFGDAEAAHAEALAAEQQRCRALETERNELRETAQTLRRERAEVARHVTDLEGSVHVTTLARDELQQRLSIVTESHQRQIVQLAEGRQVQRDLEHQLAQCAEELALTKRRLQDAEQLLTALTVEKHEFARNQETLVQANSALEQQVRQASESCAQLHALCQRERETNNEYLEKQETRQEQQKQQELEGEREKKQVLQRLEMLAQELDASEAMAREVFRLYDSLSRSESRARSQALRWRTQEERTRGHLSYRVGSALVANSRSPLKWAKIPGAVARAYGGFRRERKGRHNEPAPEIEDVLGRSPNAFLPLRQQWSEVRVQTAGVQEIWARALTVRPEALIDIEVAVVPNRPSAEPADTQGEDIGGRSGDGTPQTFELHAGAALRILRLGAASTDLRLRVRKVNGLPTILHLELRQADGVQYSASGDDASSSTMPSVNASHAAVRQSSNKGWLWDLLGKRTERAPVRKSGSIAHAQEMIRGGDFEGAIEYALSNASDVERPTIELLCANHVLADEQAWLRHLNAYMRQFRIAPMELAPGGPSRYLRLQARQSRRIDTGPVVSVIMPAFNAARTLEFAARSILNQTWRPLELIIVDDASDDATSSIAGELTREDPRVKLFRNTANVGPYVSKDLGLLMASGAYVTGHDADDWAHPERIEIQLEAMLRGGAKASLIKMLRLTDGGEFRRIGKNTPNIDDGVLQTAFISCMLETQFLRDRLGHWDSVRFGADSELIFRAQRVLGGDLPVYRQLGLLCLDSQGGLTADPVYGASRAGGLSPTRASYRETFLKWQETITPEQAYLPFPHHPRRFAAPEVTLVPADVIIDLKNRVLEARVPDGDKEPCVTSWPEAASSGERRVDVCIVTNLAYPGGNASSTLDEVRECLSAGLSVRLLHCPVARGGNMEFSARFNDYLYLCEDCRSHHASYCCDVLIVRHPGVICSPLFADVAQSIRARATVVVINNSMFRTDGTRVYSEEELYEGIGTLPGGNTTVYPLGPAIRRELLGSSLARKVNIAPFDWSPTFSVDALRWRGARPMGRPTVIGRHGRDGQEKWLEDPEQLAAVYPRCEDVTVKILGGARRAAEILGRTPGHWHVHPFGSMAPSEFLNSLDAFVYFPNSGLNEAFGRAIMEAVFVGVPCVLPTRFHETFGQLAFCCEPGEAIPAVRRLRQSYPWCAAFVERARDLAVPQYGSQVVLSRLCNASESIARRIAAPAPKRVALPDLDNTLAAYARWVCTGEGASKLYTDGTTPGVIPTASAGAPSESETAEQWRA